jgi:YD repeat-containing protein
MRRGPARHGACGERRAGGTRRAAAAPRRNEQEEQAIKASLRGAALSPPSNVGLPVNVNTGNAWLSQVDVVLPGVGEPLVLSREYNSANAGDPQAAAGFGRGWSHGYAKAMTPTTTHRVLQLTGGSGVRTYYEDFDGDGVYRSGTPQSDRTSVTIAPDGSYVRHVKLGGQEVYDASGRWLSATDRFGQTTSLQYGSSGRLEEVREAGGRVLDFTWAGNRITQLSGPLGPVAAYGYDGAGDLATATYPDGGGYAFVYDGSGQLLNLQGSLAQTGTSVWDSMAGMATGDWDRVIEAGAANPLGQTENGPGWAYYGTRGSLAVSGAAAAAAGYVMAVEGAAAHGSCSVGRTVTRRALQPFGTAGNRWYSEMLTRNLISNVPRSATEHRASQTGSRLSDMRSRVAVRSF